MDPKTTLTEAFSLYAQGDIASSAEKLASYFEWRRKGGFEPKIEKIEWFHGLGKHLCCADHGAQWLLICILRKCAEKNLEVYSLTPDVLDRIEDTFGESN
jgi:hypothetical protein